MGFRVGQTMGKAKNEDADPSVAVVQPIRAFVQSMLSVAFMLVSSVVMHDWWDKQMPLPDTMDSSMADSRFVGWLLLAYLASLFAARVWEAGFHNCYEMLWACNIAMLLAGVAVLTDRPRLAGASYIMISLDQMLWWVECTVAVWRGADHPKRWLIGVAKYLDRPETTRVKFWTAWHHLWFSPLMLWALRGHGYVPPASYPLQVAIMTLLGCMSRFLTPYEIMEPRLGYVVYLNINLSHKFWKDIHVDWAHWYDDYPAYVYLAWVNFLMNVVNGLTFTVVEFMVDFI